MRRRKVVISGLRSFGFAALSFFVTSIVGSVVQYRGGVDEFCGVSPGKPKSEGVSEGHKNCKKLFASTRTAGFSGKLRSETKTSKVDPFMLYSRTLALLQRVHYLEVDMRRVVTASLRAALRSVDPHSAFLSPSDFEEALARTRGNFSGIGILFSQKKRDGASSVVVSDVYEGGPADRAGIKPGDKIIEVDGQDLRWKNADEVAAMIRGEEGSEVSVTILRDGSPIELKMKRERVKIKSVRKLFFPLQSIGYVELVRFSDEVPNELRNTIEVFMRKGMRALVIDLRRNPGGSLSAAVDAASLFLEPGTLVVETRDRRGRKVSEFRTGRQPIGLSNIPVVLVIGTSTASAAEIFAGSLSINSKRDEKGRVPPVFLVGERTYGKGSVQELLPIGGGYAAKITTMLYHLPDGKTPQEEGILPDVVVEEGEIENNVRKRVLRESEIEGHIRVLERAKSEKSDSGRHKNKRLLERMRRNFQVRTALQLASVAAKAAEKSENKKREKFLNSVLSLFVSSEDLQSAEEL